MLLSILISQDAWSQYFISGEIKDAKIASVYISTLDKKISSDSLGHFTISDIHKGSYLLEITADGYQTLLVNVTLPCLLAAKTPYVTLSPSANGATLSVQFISSNYTFNEVLVSGSRPTFQQKTTQPTEVVLITDMMQRGQLTVMEAMASKPGIALITTGPGIARPVIRGLSGNRIATIINGVKLENQQWDLEHTLGLNQYGIDRVEVIKGPATFLYGSDAMGGVLNFIDEKPAPVNRLIGNASAGFNSNTFGSTSEVGLKGAKENINWSLRAGLNNSSDYYDANFDRVANSRYREFLGKAALGLTHKKSVTLFSYQVNLGYYGIIEPFESDSGKTEEEEDHPMEFENPYHTLLHQTALIKNTLHLGNTKLISTLSYQNDQRKELEPGNTEENPYLGLNLNVGTLNVKADHRFSDNVSLIIGGEGSLQNNSNSGYGRLIPDYDQSDFAVFGVNRLTLFAKRFTIDLGVRHDIRNISSSQNGLKDSVDYMAALTRNFSNTSASIGFNLLATQNITLYANVGTGYRAPNMAELTSNGIRLETQRYEVGNSAFNKETNQQVDAGIILTGKQYNIEISAFYNNIDQYIFITPRGDSISQKAVYAFNQANAWIYGMESKLSIAPEAIKWVKLSSAFGMLQGYQSGGSYLPLMPPYKLNVEITLTRQHFYAFSNTFTRIGMQNVWSQNRIAATEIQTPAYMLLNLSFGGDISLYNHPIKVALGVNNLLNEKYYDHLSRLRVYGVYGLGLNAFLSINCPLDLLYP